MKTIPFFSKIVSDIEKLPQQFLNEDILDYFLLLACKREGGKHHFHAYVPKDLDRTLFHDPAVHFLGMRDPGAVALKEPDFGSVHFVSRLALGDAFTMTCGIRDFKKAFPNVKIKVTSTAPRVWDNNPYIDQDITPEKTVNVGTGWLTNASNRLNLHMANAYRISIQNETGLTFDQGPIRPDIWLSGEEYDAPPLIEGPYWVIILGGELGWPLKMYPLDKWQQVVDALPDIRFVQLGASEHTRAHGKLANNRGNVIDFVGKTQDPKTGIRDLFKIFLHAQGSVGLVSMHMHLSAAFNNPCVVIAGAREPAWFTHYMGHQYLHVNGCLPCAEERACWHCGLEACKNLRPDGKTPTCADIIRPEDVTAAIMKYYDGGRLKIGEKIMNPFFKNVNRGKEKVTIATGRDAVTVPPKPVPQIPGQKVLRLLTSCRGFGGSEKSTLQIMKMFIEKGWRVELVPWGGRIGTAYNKAIPEGVIASTDLTGPCDVLLYYCTDTVYFPEMNDEKFNAMMGRIKADRKVMAINYRIGHLKEKDWAKGWDQYLFLCSQKDAEWKGVVPGASTQVLAPATDLAPFFEIKRRYHTYRYAKLIRHNSQGDAKWPADINAFIHEVNKIDKRTEWYCMPPASFLMEDPKIFKFAKNEVPIPEFLSKGNCFIYNLPDGYQDQGPRVIMEAMATGLPVIADNRWGAKDRVPEEAGWLCDTREDYFRALQDIAELPSLLATKGKSARKIALDTFDPYLWVKAITGE